MYPLLMDALGAGKISVGPPYFDAVFTAIMAPGIFLMGLGPLAKWKKASLPEIGTRLKIAAVISVVSALLIPLSMGKLSLMAAVGVFMGIWVVSTTLILLRNRIQSLQIANASLMDTMKTVPLAFYGMLLAHLGVGVFILGVTLVKGYESEQDLRMELNDIAIIDGMTFKFNGAKKVLGANYVASQGEFVISQNGNQLAVLKPEKRFYPVQGSVMTEADIKPGIIKDLYISLGEPLENGAWSVRIYIKPFVQWIWAGCILMALGGFLALTDKRYRIVNKKVVTAVKVTPELPELARAAEA
jgi:cytochrome c-type biogenesis protein CcmF